MISLVPTRNRNVATLAADLGRLAPTELSLLVEGETGTGKSFLAGRIHRRSRRARPLVVLDCAALAPGLLASELYGHVAGAFTDATRARVGVFERAGSGTLVLDRIDALAVEVQAALLRVLEERRVYPVGAAAPRAFRARVIALVDAGLETALAAGRFRRDLYHRLAGFHAVLPPLRQRPEDIVPFAHQVLRRRARVRGYPLGLHEEAERLLVAYPWPGNFRELATVLARCSLQVGEDVVAAHQLGLAESWRPVAELAAERALSLVEVERLYGLWVLARHGGNVSRAARTLGISRRTLIRWRREA